VDGSVAAGAASLTLSGSARVARNMYFGGYGLYILISLPALLLGFWAQLKVKSAYNKYSRVKIMSAFRVLT